MRNEKLHRIVWLGMLSALAFVLVTFGQVYVPPFPDYLRYDFGDIPALIGAYVLGPVAGLIVQTVKALLFMIFGTGLSSAGLVGVMANFLAGATLVVAVSVVHHMVDPQRNRHVAWGLVSVVAATLIMALLIIPVNALVVFPAYGVEGAGAWAGALANTPFNLFKGFASCTISLVFYRRLEPFILGRVSGRAA
ncbi:MAG TPA: ECF transporter S component [Symbiobacteriaceae bacterium]|nr:ECF transporter S component [Symbiobacteriaceae bacterium]